MLVTLALLAGLALPPMDPVQASLSRYRSVESYRTTLMAKHGGASEVIRYVFKKPGFVRMEFIRPHEGAVLTYDPGTRIVRLRPFGFAKAIVLTLDPSNSLVKSPTGHRVDQSDIGALLERVVKLQEQGVTGVMKTDMVPGRAVVEVTVEGRAGVAVDGVHKYVLDLDESSMLPVRVRAYQEDGTLLEQVSMTDLEADVPLEDSLFKP